MTPEKNVTVLFLRYGGIFFLFCTLFSNVGIYCMASPQDLPLFTPGALGWVAAGILAGCAPGLLSELKKLPRTLLVSGAVLWILFFLHLFSGKLPGWKSLHLPGEAMLILCIPLLFYLCFHNCRKAWIRTGAFLWGLNTLVLLWGFFRGAALWKNGICGNENWSAALLYMGLPFVYLYGREKCHHPKAGKVLLWGLLLLCTGFNVWIFSKGALLSAFLCICLYLFLLGNKKIRVGILAGILLLLTAGAFMARIHAGKVEKFLTEDARLPLYRGALRLLRENPVTGTGVSRFENELMKHRPEEYFFVFNPASRSNHPHNHFLYVAGTQGMVGLLCCLFLLGIPLFQTARSLYRHEKCEEAETACFFILLYGLLHGSLDLVMEVWPTRILALSSLGGLLFFRKRPDGKTPGGTVIKNPWLPAAVSAGTAGIFLLCGLFIAFQALYAQLRIRELRSGSLSRKDALKRIRETVQMCPGNYPVNFACMTLLEREYRDPLLSLEVSEIMLKGNTPNYPGIHMGRGNALMRLGRFQEAWEHYRQDALLFPLTLRPVYNMVVAARAMKNYPLAAQCEQLLLERMKIRKLDKKDLYKILTGKGVLDLRAGYKP